MKEYHLFLVFAILFAGMAFIVPQIMNLRIKLLNFIHLSRLANWHEKHFKFLVNMLRVMMVAMSALMLYLYFQ